MTRFDKDHGLLLDEGMMGAQVRTLYPGTLGVHAVLISEGPGKHEDLFSTPVLVWNEALTSGPMDKGRAIPAVVERDVDPVLAYRVTDHMRDGLVLALLRPLTVVPTSQRWPRIKRSRGA